MNARNSGNNFFMEAYHYGEEIISHKQFANTIIHNEIIAPILLCNNYLKDAAQPYKKQDNLKIHNQVRGVVFDRSVIHILCWCG